MTFNQVIDYVQANAPTVVDAIADPPALALTIINAFVCAGVFWACMCRMRLTSTETIIRARITYSIVMVVSLCSALRGPLFGSQVTSYWPILLSLGTWFILLLNIRAWRHAPPPHMQKNSGAMPLHDD